MSDIICISTFKLCRVSSHQVGQLYICTFLNSDQIISHMIFWAWKCLLGLVALVPSFVTLKKKEHGVKDSTPIYLWLPPICPIS